MNDETTQGPQDKKRVYHTPELVQVPLRPEEAVLGACKSSTSLGPVKPRCNSPAPACNVVGS